jgi:type IX secretion system PorP/SprF family membrane protein
MRLIILHIIIFIAFAFNVKSQDIHFSQFNEAPMLLNPANAGMYSGDYRAVLNFKEQWSSIKNGYKTYAAQADFTILKNNLDLKSTGLGVSFFQDIAGTSKTKTSRIDLNISQTVYLNEQSDLTLGLGASYMDLSANYVGLLWESQWDGQQFDGASGSGEAFTGLGKKIFDFSAGILYRNFDANGHPLEVGLSAFHLTQPEIGIFNYRDVIPYEFRLHANKEINFQRRNDLGAVFTAFVANQRTAREINLGFLIRKDFGVVSQYTGYYRNVNLYLGGFYRVGDAIIVMSKVLIKGAYAIGLSYDINISPLVAASKYRGGFELSLSYSGVFKEYKVASPKYLKH